MKDCSALLDSSAACTGGSGKVVEVFWLDFSRWFVFFFFVGGVVQDMRTNSLRWKKKGV